MPFRVTPKDAFVYDDHQMSSSISLGSDAKDLSMVHDSIPEQENVNEQLLKQLDEIYSPVLKVMKLFGTFFGDASLSQMKHVPGRFRKWVYLEALYCGVVVSGFWLNFIMAIVDLFVGGSLYLFIMFSLWCFLIAVSGTICLFVLCTPLADLTKSRFAIFIRGLLGVNRNINLVKVKTKSRRGLIIFFCFFMVASAAVVATDLLSGFNLSSSVPWNQWPGFRIISASFLFMGCGVWFLPVFFFYTTCLILEELFDDLHKQMSSLNSISMDLAFLKTEFQKLCEVVELADKLLAPLLLGLVSLYIPLICFILYQTINLPQEGNMEFMMGNVFWILAKAALFMIVMKSGSNVNEKIHSFQKTLQTFSVSKEDEGKLVMFMLDLQGDPKGISIGGLAVITKDLSITIVGVIISYFTVMLSLPK